MSTGQPPMPGDNLALAIDQDRDIEVEGPDAVGDLPDLLLAMAPRVRGVELELVDRPINDFKQFRLPGWRPLSHVGWRFHDLFL